MMVPVHLFAACAFGLMLLGSVSATAAPSPGVPMSGNTEAARAADTLRNDIRAAYEHLRARGELTGSVQGMSINGIVGAHVKPGMKLDTAEQLLRAAGFGLAPASTETATVYASSDTILPNAVAGVRNEVVVVLTPQGAGAAAIVGTVDARIIVTTL